MKILVFLRCPSCYKKGEHPHRLFHNALLPQKFYHEVVAPSSSVLILLAGFKKYSHLDLFGSRMKANTPSGYGDYLWKSYAEVW